jgi:hypothetical protein
MAPHSEVDTVTPAAEAPATTEAPAAAKEQEKTTNGTHTNGGAKVSNGEFEIPKSCKAGVVYNPGPDFKVVVEDVPVPEPGLPVLFRLLRPRT